MAATAFHFPSGGKYTKEAAFWEASHFLSRDFLLWFWIAKKLRIRPELLCLCALACALFASMAILHGQWWGALLWAHLNNAIDCADGTLARYTGTASRFGRFVDVTCDGIGMTAISVSLALQWAHTYSDLSTIILGVVFWLTLFLECSMANYVNVRYATATHNTSINSRIDERISPNDPRPSPTQKILMRFYAVVFGWQDRWCDTVHRFATRHLSAKQNQKLDTTKWILSAHSLFFFGIVIQSIILMTAITSLTIALTAYFLISTVAFGMLMVTKIAYAKNTSTTHLS